MSRVHNFSAGPGVLPVEVLEQAKADLVDYKGNGLSVMEMSHRGGAYDEIHETAQAKCRELYGIPDDYALLFLQGGATSQFSLIAKNFLHGKADYVVTGAWSKKAIASAKLEGDAHTAWDGKETNYDRAPDLDVVEFRDGLDYIHICSNETIQGVDYLKDPKADAPLVCDMSSNIGSRPFDVSNYHLIYAGAQKNMGPAGMAMVTFRKDWLDRVPAGLDPMFDYRHQWENDSRYNTPPTWTIYMCGLVYQHWIDFGGLEKVAEHNERKAALIYDTIDGSDGFYIGHAKPDSRSRMNIPFVIRDEALHDDFLQEAASHQMSSLKGHRSVGGIRASIYNACPMESVQALADFMRDFAQRKG